MHRITDWLGGLSGPVVYAVVAALVFAEDALFVGFVIPGETAAVLGGVLANQGKVEIGWLMLAVIGAAILGDSTGYEVGNRLGPRILELRALRRHAHRIAGAQDLIRRRGPAAVFLGRFIAFFRAMMPALAGIARMPYRRFLLFNALGGITWGAGFTLLGYFAGAAYSKVEGLVGRGVAIVVAALVVVALIVRHVRRERAESDEPAAADRGKPDAAESDEPAAADPGKPEAPDPGKSADRPDSAEPGRDGDGK